MYFVYYGHVTSDNYDSYPQWQLVKCTSISEVDRLFKEWNDPEYTCHEDCTECLFRIIEGKEIKPVPVTRITEWEFK